MAFGVLVFAWAVTGCGAAHEASTEPVRVELGIGADEFIPLVDGQQVNVIGTPQLGGFRIVSAIRVYTKNGETADVALSARLKDTEEAVNEPATLSIDLVPVEPGIWEKASLATFIPEPARVHGQDLIMRADVTVNDVSASDEKLVIPE